MLPITPSTYPLFRTASNRVVRIIRGDPQSKFAISPMNIQAYAPGRSLRPMSNHVDIRQGIAAGSARRFTPNERQQIIKWLAGFGCSHFLSLASNDLDLRSAQRHLIRGFRGHDRMVALARAWEGRMNRRLLGPRWAQPSRSSERLKAFYFLERPYSNPHWHVLARIQEPDPTRYMEKIAKLQDHTDGIWSTIIRSGSTDIKQIFDEGAANYVAKELPRPVSWDYFIPAGYFDPTG